MDTLDAMRVFAAVAERSGFSAAADALDRSTANVTRQVAALEQRGEDEGGEQTPYLVAAQRDQAGPLGWRSPFSASCARVTDK